MQTSHTPDLFAAATPDTAPNQPHGCFAANLVDWQHRHGRHDLPWQVRDPYRVWLSEVMLQQTQVRTVAEYYPRFVQTFPTVAALAAADEDTVLSLWQGLGYYSRARNLHKAAKQIVAEFGGVFPQERSELEKLCGVGRSTAAAIAAFCFHARESILDGNVKRVLCRVFALDGDLTDKTFDAQLWQLAQSLLPEQPADMPAYTQGLMDLGATLCTRSKPNCPNCPMHTFCRAYAENRQHELPRKKNAAKVREIALFWLVIQRRDGALWLQKRPSKGIWGGLWCVPCTPSFQAATDTLAAFGLDERDITEAPTFTHRLTHRLLYITPLVCTLPDDAAQPHIDGQWVLPRDRADFGLPKPLSSYLSENKKIR